VHRAGPSPVGRHFVVDTSQRGMSRMLALNQRSVRPARPPTKRRSRVVAREKAMSNVSIPFSSTKRPVNPTTRRKVKAQLLRFCSLAPGSGWRRRYLRQAQHPGQFRGVFDERAIVSYAVRRTQSSHSPAPSHAARCESAADTAAVF
jgi:hypothetical protein